MKTPIITLLTDFGTKDHYAASIKGVILGINPRCRLVDISHQVTPHDIREGAFLLANAYSCFPRGTIHLAVVDPGVGSPRKPVLIVTQNYCFLGPDNGLFSLALQREKVEQIIELTRPRFFRSVVSTTFHGRDLFAPVAGHLSLGVKPRSFGPKLDSCTTLDIGKPSVKWKKLMGQLIHIDAFGNLISNITEEQFARFTGGRPFLIQVGKETIGSLKKAYWEGEEGELMALIGSGGLLEISVRESSAQRRLRTEQGDPISIGVIPGC
jgi:S-adenosyl-L-methionine hydrolase (adenosine-forming)